MDALRRKLHDQRGVSMLMALLLMLVALMVSAVVVAGASSAVSALRTDQKQEQAALTVTSPPSWRSATLPTTPSGGSAMGSRC